MTDDLSASLQAAEQRIKELEAKVRQLEDRADRAERWVYKIWVEIEQKFFGGTKFVSRSRRILGRLFLEGIETCKLTEDSRPTTEDRGTLPRGLRRVIHRDRLGGGWVVELVFGLGGHVGGACDE